MEHALTVCNSDAAGGRHRITGSYVRLLRQALRDINSQGYAHGCPGPVEFAVAATLRHRDSALLDRFGTGRRPHRLGKPLTWSAASLGPCEPLNARSLTPTSANRTCFGAPQ